MVCEVRSLMTPSLLRRAKRLVSPSSKNRKEAMAKSEKENDSPDGLDVKEQEESQSSARTMEREEPEVMRPKEVAFDLKSSENARVISSDHVGSRHVDSARKQRPNMKDFAKIVQISSRFAEISEEQLTRVQEMHDRFSEGAEFSFNYNTLLGVASVLAGLGLVSDSPSTVIASMLVSPIMGPVVGMAYGTTIMDWCLVKKSLKVELISILFCIVTGALLAAMIGTTSLAQDWPTNEMKSRGEWSNFFLGFPIAFFSGLGVAVSLLDDQTSSLVGVAISASLLPPAVNCGISFVAYSFVKAGQLGGNSFFNQNEELWTSFEDENYTFVEGDVADGIHEFGAAFAERLDEFYEASRFNHSDFNRMGILSISLTVVNIVLIYMSSMLMFRMKEVLPIKKKIFWEDLGVARKIYTKKAFMFDNSMGVDDKEDDDNKYGDSPAAGGTPPATPSASREDDVK